MKLPRNLSGASLADHLCRHWDYVRVRQSGSHIQLRTNTPTPGTQTIPSHSPLATNTLGAILGQVARRKGVTREDILRDL